VPDVFNVPVQAPEAMHPVAFAEDQVSVVPCPAFTGFGLAENETVGAGITCAPNCTKSR